VSQGVFLQVGTFYNSENDPFLDRAEQVNDCLDANAYRPQDLYDVNADCSVLHKKGQSYN
jgi:hypothetical protein